MIIDVGSVACCASVDQHRDRTPVFSKQNMPGNNYQKTEYILHKKNKILRLLLSSMRGHRTHIEMISITKTDVPEYLRSGELFRTLSTEDGEAFDVPVASFKTALEVMIPGDLEHLLSSLSYWMVDAAPIELLEFILDIDGDE